MKFKTKMKIFIKSLHRSIKVKYMSSDELKAETQFLISDNYRLMRSRVSNKEIWGDIDINNLFIEELYAVIAYIPAPFKDKDLFLLRSECLFKLYNDIRITRGEILDVNIDVDLKYIRYKNIQYGGTVDEIF